MGGGKDGTGQMGYTQQGIYAYKKCKNVVKFICVYASVQVCASEHLYGGQRTIQWSWSALLSMSHRDRTQDIRFSNEYLYPLKHLTLKKKTHKAMSSQLLGIQLQIAVNSQYFHSWNATENCLLQGHASLCLAYGSTEKIKICIRPCSEHTCILFILDMHAQGASWKGS